MDRFEIFTIGGGRYLFNFFNAMAAIAQSDAYAAVITSALMIGAIQVIAKMAFSQQGGWPAIPRYLLLITCMLYGALYPKATVKITDTIDPVNSGGYIVANVPWGPAFLTSIFTMASHEITTLLEDNLIDADTPKYTRNGMVFGATLLANATRLEVRDTNFSASMGSFIRQCLFYDILHGRKSMDDLMKAADPWAYIISNPAKSRWFEIHDTGAGSRRTTDIKTCAAGVGDLNAKWSRAVRDASTSLALANAPHKITRRQGGGYVTDSAQLRLLTAHLQTNLQAFHRYLIGASRASGEILRRQMTINAIMNEGANWNAETGNAAALERLAGARVDLQTGRSYNLAGRQALQWVPATHATLQAVFSILFLLVFPVWLMPNGLRFMGYYITALAWLATWGPVMVILNYIYTSNAQEEMRAAVMQADVALQDIPYMASAGIKAVEAKIANAAGNMMMMTGAVTIALFAGVGRWSYIAGDNLRVAQEANAAAAAEATTGNLSYANTGTGNHSFQNINGHHTNMSSSWDSTRSTAYADSGAPITQTGDGRWVAGAGSGSQFQTELVSGDQIFQSLTSAANESDQVATNASERLTDLQSATRGWGRDYADSISGSDTSGLTYGVGSSANIKDDFSTINTAAKSFAQTNKVSEEDAISGALAAKAAIGKFGIGADAEAQYRASTNSSLSFEDAMKFAQDDRVSQAFDNVMNASRTESAGEQISDTRSYADRTNAAYSDMQSLQSEISASRTQSHELRSAAAQAETMSAGINASLNQPFYEWLQKQPSLTGSGEMGPVEAQELLNTKDMQGRETAREYGRTFLETEAHKYITNDEALKALNGLDLDQEHQNAAGGVTTQASIEDTMQSHANAVPDGSSLRGQNRADSQRIQGAASAHMQQAEGRINQEQNRVEGQLDAAEQVIGPRANQNVIENLPSLTDRMSESHQEWKKFVGEALAPDGPNVGIETTKGMSMPDESSPSMPDKSSIGMGQPNTIIGKDRE